MAAPVWLRALAASGESQDASGRCTRSPRLLWRAWDCEGRARDSCMPPFCNYVAFLAVGDRAAPWVRRPG